MTAAAVDRRTWAHNHKVAWLVARQGIKVFPCYEADDGEHRAKAPRSKGGFLNATCDEGVIAEWWRQWPGALVGMNLADAGLLAVDLDRHGGPDGVAEWEPLAALYGFDGALHPRVSTPGNGQHIYFKRPEGMVISNRTGSLPRGIDIRGAGYTIAPRCILPDGREYERVEGSVELTLDIPEAPDWLVDMIDAPAMARPRHDELPVVPLDGTVEVAAAIAVLAADAGAVEGAAGNKHTYDLGCRLRAVGVSEAKAFDLMSDGWNDRCAPPWSIEELGSIIANAFRYGQGAPGAKSPRLDFAGVDIPPIDRRAQRQAQGLLPLIDPGEWSGLAVPERRWALNGWMPARQVTYLTGSGGEGKSLLAQQLCTCIALGRPFLGIPTTATTAIYLTCEDDADELHRRQQAICEMLGVDLRDLSGRLHLVALVGATGNELASFDQHNRMKVEPGYGRLAATIEATGAGFAALDNVAHLFAGNENIRAQVAAFVGLLNQLAQRGASVLLLGHPNKAGDAFSGSTAWENQVRSRLFLSSAKAAAEATGDADGRIMSRGKANYAKKDEVLTMRWHRWAFVNEADLPPGEAERSADARRAADDELFLACLHEWISQHRAVSEKHGPTFAPAKFAGSAAAKGVGKARLEAAMGRLLAAARIENGHLWKKADRKPQFGLHEITSEDGQS